MRIVNAAAAVDAKGELRNTLLAVRLRLGRITFIAFELRDNCDFQFGRAFGFCELAPAVGAAARSDFVSAELGALATLACFCLGFFSRGFSMTFGGVTACNGSAFGSGGNSSFFSSGFSGSGSGSASCCCGPGGISFGTVSGATGSAASSIVITGAFATRSLSFQRASRAAAPATWNATASAKQTVQRALSGQRRIVRVLFVAFIACLLQARPAPHANSQPYANRSSDS